MRALMKEYGLTVLAVIVGIGTICTVYAVVLMQYRITHPLPNPEEYPAKAMEEYQYGGEYEVKHEVRTIETGQKVAVADYFKVWDAKGNPGQVEILEVMLRDENKGSCVLSKDMDKWYMTFPVPGEYVLSLRVSVPNQREQLLEVNIPVQQAKPV